MVNLKTGAVKDIRDDRDYILESLGSSRITDEEWKFIDSKIATIGGEKNDK
jgi:hypothetical protein